MKRPTKDWQLATWRRKMSGRDVKASSLGPGKQAHWSSVQRTHTPASSPVEEVPWRSSFAPHSRNSQAMSSSLNDVLTAETERWQRIWKTRKVGKGAAAATALARSGEAGAVPRTRKSRPRWRDASGKCSVYVFFGEPFWTTNSDRMYVQRHRMVEKWHFGKMH